MAEPIEFRIVQNRQQALQAISVGAGYFYDVRGTGVKLNPDYDVEALVEENAPRPWITIETQSEEWVYAPANVLKLGMPLRIHWFNDGGAQNDEELRLMCYRAYADIEKAIVADLTCGGLAVDTRITARAGAFSGGSVWVAVDLLIRVFRTYGEASA